MEFLGWFALSGHFAWAAAAASFQGSELYWWFSLSGFLSGAAIWGCSVFAVRKLGYKATDVDARLPVNLGLIIALIISLLIVRECQ